MKHKFIFAAVFLMGSSSLFAQTQESSQPKVEIKTTKPATPKKSISTNGATPLNTQKQPVTVESRSAKKQTGHATKPSN